VISTSVPFANFRRFARRNTLPACPQTQRIGVGFDVSDGLTVRLSLSTPDAIHLCCTLADHLEIDGFTRGPGHATGVVYAPLKPGELDAQPELRQKNDPDSEREDQHAEQIEECAQRAHGSPEAPDLEVLGNVDPCLQRVIDPLADSDRDATERHQLHGCVGHGLQRNGESENEKSERAGDQHFVPMLQGESAKEVHHGGAPSKDWLIRTTESNRDQRPHQFKATTDVAP